jgi:hypothetical protein
MSALGQKQASNSRPLMSALPPKADIDGYSANVRFVPIAEVGRVHSITLSARAINVHAERSRCFGSYRGTPQVCKCPHRQASWLHMFQRRFDRGHAIEPEPTMGSIRLTADQGTSRSVWALAMWSTPSRFSNCRKSRKAGFTNRTLSVGSFRPY